MPKELEEIKRFTSGIVSSVSAEDLNTDAAAYSLNVDPRVELGRLRPVPTDDTDNYVDAEIGAAGVARGAVQFKDVDGKYRLFWFSDEGATGDFRVIEDFYGTPNLVADVDTGLTNYVDKPPMEVHNSAVHIGMGNSATPPKWYGYVANKNRYWTGAVYNQVKSAWDKYLLLDAEIDPQKVSGASNNPVWADNGSSPSGTGGALSAGMYFFKYSLVYEGGEESVLSVLDNGLTSDAQFTVTSVTLNDEVTFDLHVRTGASEELNERVIGINLYSAFNPTSGAGSPVTLYRLLKAITIDDAGDTWSTESGGVKLAISMLTLTGPTYESSSGQLESSTGSVIHYGLSTQENGHHFVANVYNPQASTEDWGRYILKSEPLQFSVFNWVVDHHVLPEVPVAIKAHGGRVYAFTHSKMFRVNPDQMSLEDIHDGVGCLGARAVISTDYGMFWMDENNFYMNSGEGLVPIGDPIVESNDVFTGLHDLTVTDVEVAFDGSRMAVLFFVEYSGGKCVFAYSVAKQRWDCWDCEDVQAVVTGRFSEPLMIEEDDGDVNIIKYLGHASNKRTMVWESARLTLGESTNDKFFYAMSVQGSGSITKQYQMPNRAMSTVDASGVLDDDGDPPKNQDKWIIVRVVTTGDSYVESIGVTYRRKVKKIV
jgi:hypothetical protein